MRYKILIQEGKIAFVLYNTGSEVIDVPFEELRLEEKKELLEVRDSSVSTKGSVLAKISRIPIAMIASKDKEKLEEFEQGYAKNMPLGVERCA